MWSIIRSPLSILTSILCFSGVISDSYNHLVFPPLPIAVESSSNLLCQKHSDLYRQNLDNYTLWAYEMWDATAKSPTGFLRGNLFQMGHFDECIDAKAPFKTQYCLATITANIPAEKSGQRDPFSLYHPPNEYILYKLYPNIDKAQQKRNVIKLGWCIPASCGVKDLEDYLNKYVKELDLPLKHENVTYSAKFSNILCNTNEEIVLNTLDIIFCIISASLAFGIIFSTIYTYGHENQEQRIKKSLFFRLTMAFSANKNFHDLGRKNDSDPALVVMYGVRTFCIFIIILGHTSHCLNGSPVLNFDFFEMKHKSIVAPLVYHSDVIVDSFFLLSGLLVTYGLLDQFNKKVINPGFILLIRYVRLTPVYAFLIFYYATIFNYTGNGPLWKLITSQESQDCRNNWWTNLLYINNYVNVDHICMVQTWYLPCDTHFFIIAIGVCLLIHKNKKLGLGVLLALLLTGMLLPFLLTVINNRPALMLHITNQTTYDTTNPDFQLTYVKSHTRSAAYFVGMFVGYVYLQRKGTSYHLSRVKSYILLGASLALAFVSVFGASPFFDSHHPYNALESGVYAALNRPAFAIGSAGVIYVASYGQVDFIYKFLTWSPWVPLSKLSYCAYLVHLTFQLRAVSVLRNSKHSSTTDIFIMTLSDIVLAFGASLVLYLAVEAPFKNVFKVLFMPTKEIQKNTNVTHIKEVDSSRL